LADYSLNKDEGFAISNHLTGLSKICYFRSRWRL